uniref:Cytochrome c oxidase subunit 3 n=1 Tax=Neomaskellia andropogonis TaxID=266944 RepID=Q697F5_NEOAD|nr:cytochrome oxidase subunit III [Neomaskellia andropogonis]
MMMNQMFHLVNLSPWPILSSLNLLNMSISFILSIIYSNPLIYLSWGILMINIMFQWWGDMTKENLFKGEHTFKVMSGFSMGMIMFILSEIMFFFSFFWMFFYLSLSPDVELMMKWPPLGISKISFLDLPLLNTIILLYSGFFVTWSHYSMMIGKMESFKFNLFMTLLMGVYFYMIQLYEYFQAPFDFSMSVFGSSFFILTGFHGFHVMVGIIFLLFNLIQYLNFKKSYMLFLSFEYPMWYWHFVDIIWLFLFLVLYWWKT